MSIALAGILGKSAINQDLINNNQVPEIVLSTVKNAPKRQNIHMHLRKVLVQFRRQD